MDDVDNTSADRPKSSSIATIVGIFLNLYFISVVVALPYFNFRYANKHGFVNWLLLGEIVPTAQALVWPYFAFSESGSGLTSKERAFAEIWNQWVEDHPEEINDLRTRAIADNMTKEDIARETIRHMVRFSNEANLDIPQDRISRKAGKDYYLPVLYFTELIGLALGHPEVKTWFSRHFVDPLPLLQRKGLL